MTKIDYDYHFSYLIDTALWMFDGFLAPIHHVIRQLPPDVLSEIADDGKGFNYLRIHPEAISTVLDDELVVSQPPVFIAPNPAVPGLVLENKSIDGEGFLVYLSPELLERPPAEMEAIIAVQFAHVLLQQQGYLSDRIAELCETSTAHGLAESWGFQVPSTFDWDASFAENDTESIGSDGTDVGELLHTASLLWVGSEYREHLRNVFSRLLKSVLVLDRLRELKPVFFAPEHGLLARTMPAPDIDDINWRVYLSPDVVAGGDGVVDLLVGKTMGTTGYYFRVLVLLQTAMKCYSMRWSAYAVGFSQGTTSTQLTSSIYQDRSLFSQCRGREFDPPPLHLLKPCRSTTYEVLS